MDDIILTTPENEIDHTVSTFNSFHPRLQFSLEIETHNKLNFLDITLISVNNTILYDWYHKPSFSERYLNFFSQHPLYKKTDTIKGLIDRTVMLSHLMFHPKNIKFIINVLLSSEIYTINKTKYY